MKECFFILTKAADRITWVGQLTFAHFCEVHRILFKPQSISIVFTWVLVQNVANPLKPSSPLQPLKFLFSTVAPKKGLTEARVKAAAGRSGFADYWGVLLWILIRRLSL